MTPEDPIEGDFFFDPLKNIWQVYKDGEWVEIELKQYHTSNDGIIT
tara:strand:- start:878 stop:1015 length:138 start_codon:yes stop_codon:yes gene_type:complete